MNLIIFYNKVLDLIEQYNFNIRMFRKFEKLFLKKYEK